jgi:hypothetical protein
VGRSAGQSDPPDGTPAARAWLTRPAVDSKFVLVFSLPAVPAHVIANAGAALLNRSIQDRHNGAAKPIRFLRMHRAACSIRMKPGLKQCFIRIDIADTGQNALVQQHCL